MSNAWIIDVLSDLRSFAAKNGMTRLERQIFFAELTAKQDLEETQGDGPSSSRPNDLDAGELHRSIARRNLS